MSIAEVMVSMVEAQDPPRPALTEVKAPLKATTLGSLAPGLHKRGSCSSDSAWFRS